MFKPNPVTIIVVLLILLSAAVVVLVSVTLSANRNAREAAFLGLEIDRQSTLISGSVIVPVRTQTPGIFEPTLTAIAALNTYVPVSQELDGIMMVEVPAGCFFMGSTLDIKEQPIVQQCFQSPYWIGQTEVTNAQYKAFIDDGGYNTHKYWTSDGWTWRFDNTATEDRTQPAYWRESAYNAPDKPVIGVSWYEAEAYTAWLTAKYRADGLIGSEEIIRLPTEVEWEYAARGPDSLQYPWGNDWIAANAVTSESYFLPKAGSFPAGASWVGALDMTGNVWEWQSTIYDPEAFPYPYPPQGKDDGRENLNSDKFRSLRGGTLINVPDFARSSHRYGSPPDSRQSNPHLGFRLVRSPSL